MDLNKNTLVEFEYERNKYSYIPPFGSDSFYKIGESDIDLYCADDSSTDYLFELTIQDGIAYVGDGKFYIGKANHYSKINISNNSELINDGELYVYGDINVFGSVTLKTDSTLNVNQDGLIMFDQDSTLTIENDAAINMNEGNIQIYGKIIIDVSLVDDLLNTDGIYIDSSAILIVKNIDLGDREFSMTDYESLLRDKVINSYTQGEYNVENGKIGYTWKGGSIKNKSQVIELSTIYGSAVLGDYKLSILGTQENIIPNLQVIRNLNIRNGSTLYIAESFNGYQYLMPELYLGIINSNCKESGYCTVHGTIIVDGNNAKITIDRGARLVIEGDGYIYLKNNSIIKSVNNGSNIAMYINGTLVIDDISQLSTFESSNIQFGDNGKIIILNSNTDEHHILFSTPLGIKNSELYRLFEDQLDHIEYHIQSNCGIKIDKYFEYYNREMTDWYGGMRIEKAIYDGLIIWHDNAFIELDHSIIPWVTKDSTLLHAARIFKSNKSFDDERLQEVTNHMIYAGSGNICFRFIEDEEFKDIILILDNINMRSITNSVTDNEYVLNTNMSGELFMKNNISNVTSDDIIDEKATLVHLNSGDTYFAI